MKIAVCTPVHGETKAQYSHSIFRMAVHSLRSIPDLELEIFLQRSSHLPENRNRLTLEALEWGANYLLWIDADQVFPARTLVQLLAHQVDLIGCNIARRVHPTGPTAYALANGGSGGPIHTTRQLAADATIQEVGQLGFGLVLIRARVFAQIKELFTSKGLPNLPWFSNSVADDGTPAAEDATFISLARQAGFKVYVDHNLSWEVGHVGEHVFTNAETKGGGSAYSILAPTWP